MTTFWKGIKPSELKALIAHHKAASRPEALSESKTLTEAIEAIKRSVRHSKMKDAMQDLKEAVYLLSQLRTQASLGVHANPGTSRKAQRFISRKIRKLAHEGYQAPQRIRVAYEMARQRGFRVPPAPRGSATLRRGRGRAFLRRGNPTLAVLGANPPAAKSILATWGKIEYTRIDDPEGNNVVREHEFADGFIAKPMKDGSILLRHPQHSLWTQR